MVGRKKTGRKEGTTLGEIEERVTLTFELMLRGMRPHRIWEFLVANVQAKTHENPTVRAKYRAEYDWGVTRRQVDRYYLDACERLKSMHVIDGHSALRRSLLRKEMLLDMAVSKGDLTNARGLEKDIDRLLALDVFEHGAGSGGVKREERTSIQLPGGNKLDL